MFTTMNTSTLLVHEPISDSLMALVLLTCQLVYNTINGRDMITREFLLAEGAILYNGKFKSESAAEKEGIEPAYAIEFVGRALALEHTSLPPNGEITVLKGEFVGLTKKMVELKGFNSTTTAKRAGWFYAGWSFEDFDNNTFKWRETLLNTSWTLYDAKKKKVAKFDRALFSIRRCGTLVVYERVSDRMMALILLTCNIFHNTIKKQEKVSNSNSNDNDNDNNGGDDM
ncbi:hypothetical protein LPJ66_004342 [Kickxella alabastrina]|uniref:Uncharacterized protein n=1 Tax=Kickxella alabastrina TaxID=61397 RepID=A0ACC1II82_9FUNG|nr:hypothetical protein LPJ66_004342 [Kickxella alabastrina]